MAIVSKSQAFRLMYPPACRCFVGSWPELFPTYFRREVRAAARISSIVALAAADEMGLLIRQSVRL